MLGRKRFKQTCGLVEIHRVGKRLSHTQTLSCYGSADLSDCYNGIVDTGTAVCETSVGNYVSSNVQCKTLYSIIRAFNCIQ